MLVEGNVWNSTGRVKLTCRFSKLSGGCVESEREVVDRPARSRADVAAANAFSGERFRSRVVESRSVRARRASECCERWARRWRRSRQTVPLVLILEDLHWSDYSTLDLISYLARQRQRAHLMLIGTYRTWN